MWMEEELHFQDGEKETFLIKAIIVLKLELIKKGRSPTQS